MELNRDRHSSKPHSTHVMSSQLDPTLISYTNFLSITDVRKRVLINQTKNLCYMENELIELLKEVLALHGIKQQGYANGLLDRGAAYAETDARTIYANYVRQDMMNDLDDRIMNAINNI